jgi:predicted SAM-dependent methyltransferase
MGGPLRLNCGCGEYPLEGYINIDADQGVRPDIVAVLPPIPYADESIDEIYAGHFIEHLDYESGKLFLRECYRVLKPGGKLGVIVPDTREIMTRWLWGMADVLQIPMGMFWRINDLDAVNHLFLYSDVQGSRHQWMYDKFTLARAMQNAGFGDLHEIDRHFDPRLGSPAFYQCGYDGYKPRKTRAGGNGG